HMLQIDDDPAVAPLDTVENLVAQRGGTVDVEVSPDIEDRPITLAPASKAERLDRVLTVVLPVASSLGLHAGMMYPHAERANCRGPGGTRRVGHEWRSRPCARGRRSLVGFARSRLRGQSWGEHARGEHREIGRASCRERV